jgi:hypothetical protein
MNDNRRLADVANAIIAATPTATPTPPALTPAAPAVAAAATVRSKGSK